MYIYIFRNEAKRNNSWLHGPVWASMSKLYNGISCYKIPIVKIKQFYDCLISRNFPHWLDIFIANLMASTWQNLLQIWGWTLGYSQWSDILGTTSSTGPRFNIKMSSYQYRKSHCGDETVIRSSYLHNEIFYTGKISSQYWIRALVIYVNLHWWDSCKNILYFLHNVFWYTLLISISIYQWQVMLILSKRCNCLWFLHFYKSNVICRNTPGCLDQYTSRGLRMWNSQDCEAVLADKWMQRMETVKQLAPLSNLGKFSPFLWWTN